MRWEFVRIPSLPGLAWGACLRVGDPVVRVLHGSWVETRDDRFVEGAWDAPFGASDFDRSAVLAGSGGRVTANGVLFATPGNMYERLYSVRVGGDVFVSNSLAFALALSGDRLDPAHRHYYFDLLDFYRSGIRVKAKHLPLADGRSLALHDCCNLEVAPDGGFTRIEKAWPPPPASYAAYAALLEDTLRRMFANAGDPQRQWRYRPLATISQGYDSTAVAALARRAGCRAAVTFLRSKCGDRYVDDSGAAIAQQLGCTVTAYERNDYATAPGFRAEEFYLEPSGVDRTMAVMEDALVGALLLSGRSGEVVWSRGLAGHWGLPDLQHPINMIPGCALAEFRLRVGFLHFPPATIAAVHAPLIHGWNATPEMEPWSVGGAYDRPIARRIAEEAGVPRHCFGQEKKGGLEPLVAERSRLERWRIQLNDRPRLRPLLWRTVGNRFHPGWRSGSLAVQSGVDRMVERYSQALGSAQEHPAPRITTERHGS